MVVVFGFVVWVFGGVWVGFFVLVCGFLCVFLLVGFSLCVVVFLLVVVVVRFFGGGFVVFNLEEGLFRHE